MGIFRWAFAGVTALMVGSGFAVLSGNFALALVSALLVLLVVAYLPRERPPLHRRRKTSAGTNYAATYGTVDGGEASGGDCGTVGDGGGSFGGDGC